MHLHVNVFENLSRRRLGFPIYISSVPYKKTLTTKSVFRKGILYMEKHCIIIDI